ncbi:MAG: hypothetical protein ACI9BF_000202 [Candidatus Paceibacteria bacterium]|jgi:hypothetical protein
MKGHLNPKILGSGIIGFALVAGAYTISNFGEPSKTYQAASVHEAASVQRVAIKITDDDGNGIEDWKDEFVTTEPIILNKESSTYTPPDTVTGKLGIGLIKKAITSRGQGPLGRSDEEIIKDTVDSLAQEAVYKLYGTKDIIILADWKDEDIVNYGNSAAGALLRNSIPELENELNILYDIITYNSVDRMAELESLTSVYRGYRDDTLKIPVPAFLAKEHLDLINTYHAILMDIESMTLFFEDPGFVFIRLKRYEDDATGLSYSLQNMLFALLEHAPLFTVEDPALLWVTFHPDYQT